jgi:hypothetical protein
MRETPHNGSKPSIRPSWLILGLIIILSIAGYFVLRAKHEVPASGASDGTEIFGDRKVVDNSSIISFPEVVRRAKAGDPKWQLALGNAYFEGKLQLKDDIEAIKWITLASDAGHVPAHVRLGYLYDHTPGTLQNEQLAFKFYLKAAMAGDAESQNVIGRRFYEAKGVPRDYVAAYAWFNLSAANSGYLASSMRDDVVGKLMLPSKIDEAQKLSRKLNDEIEANLAKK